MQAIWLISIVLSFSVSTQTVKVKIPKSDYVWEPYPEDALPVFQKAFQDVAKSKSKMALLYHAWNILPQNGIYMVPNDFSTLDQYEVPDQEETEPSTFLDDLNAFQDRLGMALSGLEEVKAEPQAALIGEENVVDNMEVIAVRGTPGEDFPNYEDIPETSFACSEQGYIPGFYADLSTGCQTFHVCWPHKKETFLCPVGTLFNQAILSCDFWYATNCSLSPLLYNLNARVPDSVFYHDNVPAEESQQAFVDWNRSPKFHPVASKTEVYPEEVEGNLVKRRHVPREDSAAVGDVEDQEQKEDVQISDTARLLREDSPPIKAVRINSKFVSHPLFVMKRETWQRKLRDVVEEVTAAVANGSYLELTQDPLMGV